MSKQWVVVGADGMLGQDLTALLARRGEQVIGVDRDTVDITRPEDCRSLADADVLVNCAAYTAVDAAEEDEAAAFAVNAVGAANVARACADAGSRLVHISTDYVFDGAARHPYPENAPLAPRSAYGRTKAAGEWAVRAEAPEHLIVRTAFLYGAHGPCFPRTIARVVGERGGADVVADQFGQPTWTVDLADLVHRLIAADAPSGTYHGTSSGEVSWYGFAQAVAVSAGMTAEVIRPTTSDAFLRAATRPSYSVLGHDAVRSAGVEPIGPWDERWAVAAPTVLG